MNLQLVFLIPQLSVYVCFKSIDKNNLKLKIRLTVLHPDIRFSDTSKMLHTYRFIDTSIHTVCMSEAPEQVRMYVSLKATKSACFGGCQIPYQKPSKSDV